MRRRLSVLVASEVQEKRLEEDRTETRQRGEGGRREKRTRERVERKNSKGRIGERRWKKGSGVR